MSSEEEIIALLPDDFTNYHWERSYFQQLTFRLMSIFDNWSKSDLYLASILASISYLILTTVYYHFNLILVQYLWMIELVWKCTWTGITGWYLVSLNYNYRVFPSVTLIVWSINQALALIVQHFQAYLGLVVLLGFPWLIVATVLAVISWWKW